MPDFSRVAIIAHFHAQGLIRSDLLGLVEELLRHCSRVIFVSTRLQEGQRQLLPEAVEVIVRPNTGYDFYSYKTGIKRIRDMDGNLDELILINSSFLSVDPEKFVNKILDFPRAGFDVLGLTLSGETCTHIQSYLYIFTRRVLAAEEFLSWWNRLEAINERQAVILEYEIGLSVFLRDAGFKLGGIYTPARSQIDRALTHAESLSGKARGNWQVWLRRVFRRMRRRNLANKLNPTHFYWEELLQEFGVIKIELIKKNPFRMDLGILQNAEFRKILDEGLAN